ncbi:DciA family protein [Streptomyces sp. NBC_01579]|uniref:DciA family protein n=1 Tax=Streptomyces sp. NBC_01579 TaxID=2975885 RepID=UPI002F91A064
MTDTLSGVDLARVALQNARAAAKAQPQPKRRTGASAPRHTRSGGRDPMGLGDAISKMVAERGWEQAAVGGSILDQWPIIAPALAGNVAAVRFDDESRTLHLRPASPAYRTQLTLHQRDIIAKVNQAVGPNSVRQLEILRPASLTTSHGPAAAAIPATDPDAAAPQTRTRPEGYHQALAAHRAAWNTERRADPKVAAAALRQIREQAREPEDRFGDGRQALEELRTEAAAQKRTSSSDGARARALQRLAAERAGLAVITPVTEPRLDRTA